jgi:Tfp pilus assembly protein PilF
VEEAQRQLDFAWKELEQEKYGSAIKSAESTLRLDPALYMAMVVKALACEGLGEYREAESRLETYLVVTANLSQAPKRWS